MRSVDAAAAIMPSSAAKARPRTAAAGLISKRPTVSCIAAAMRPSKAKTDAMPTAAPATARRQVSKATSISVDEALKPTVRNTPNCAVRSRTDWPVAQIVDSVSAKNTAPSVSVAVRAKSSPSSLARRRWY